ncbi:hypothetical protein [Catellatospora vulcania]|uniref:hypothetical protein n=1 Tax=Catellatospora vulcania TaxID=1460450 RepID=UPI0012D37819|nr:hypothetical protein [Catellatospora vulcania]
MRETTARFGPLNTILTWAVPPLLFAAAMVVGTLSIRWAPGDIPGRESLYSTLALDLVLYGLVLLACAACFRWPRSALLTAMGVIGALSHYSLLYLHRSTDPLAGMIFIITVPLGALCAACALIAFLVSLSRNRRVQAAGSPGPETGAAGSQPAA